MEAELRDYELVTENEERIDIAAIGGAYAAPGMDNDEWEKQMDNLLANDDVEDLK